MWVPNFRPRFQNVPVGKLYGTASGARHNLLLAFRYSTSYNAPGTNLRPPFGILVEYDSPNICLRPQSSPSQSNPSASATMPPPGYQDSSAPVKGGVSTAGAAGSGKTEVNQLYFFLNGEEKIVSAPRLQPQSTLLQFLREEGLTGTKLGCGEGGCGACTITVASYDNDRKKMCTPRDLKAQKYCLVPSVSSLGLPSACRQTTIQSYVHLKLSSYRHKRMRCGPHLILLRTNWQVVHKAINACIAPLCSVDGCHVITVEGIGKIESGLHPVQ
eukprot:3830357-Rhodomonas_salina.1